MNMGWADWSRKDTELHIVRATKENHRKEGRGFYKLDEESVTTIQKDLAQLLASCQKPLRRNSTVTRRVWR